MTILSYLTDAICDVVIRLFPDLACEVGHISLTRCRSTSLGDFQCNDVMKWCKTVGCSPLLLADNLIIELEKVHFLEKVTVTGPGFLNFRLNSSWLAEKLATVLNPPLLFHGKKVIIDFSSPNVAKKMHVGHLRSTILGDSLSRLFQFCGADILRLNHLGDWGTQFGMILAFLDDYPSDKLDLEKISDIYRQSKHQFDNDPIFKQRAYEKVIALQRGDEDLLKVWERLCSISEEGYRKIYSLLGIEDLISRGESFYKNHLQSMVDYLRDSCLAEESEGAVCIFVDGYEIPFMVQKSDGGFNYDTTDLAAVRHRVEEENGEILIYVTDSGQVLHFELLEAVARKVGYLPSSVQFMHVPFGLVLGSDGKKFKTRSGIVEPLIGLLEEAIERAALLLVEKGWERSDPEFLRTSHVLGIGSVKFLDLINHRIHDYRFSYDKMLQFDGKTAPFILYSRVRALSIVRKVSCEHDVYDAIDLACEEERSLALLLLEFRDVVNRVVEVNTPHLLADYSYNLAKQFNCFVRDCRVEGSLREMERSLLCRLTADVLGKSLELLGIDLIDRM
ncbi:arginine--tRNA ligase [Candidatus Similichlamydia epinepheli]|uniref:arginine--tRNA ligase n=1 Tax=Candidatus Similichlamydia epinepheli TaxID=1903953 RepID=UPI000D38FFE4|nr:arginine--tRNA ligase [Candidatus Similichlamydia epinepheli]